MSAPGLGLGPWLLSTGLVIMAALAAAQPAGRRLFMLMLLLATAWLSVGISGAALGY
jgi:hypothetical protein